MGKDPQFGNEAEAVLTSGARVSNIRHVAAECHGAGGATRERRSLPPGPTDGIPHWSADQCSGEVFGVASGQIDQAGTADRLGVVGALCVLSGSHVDNDLLDAMVREAYDRTLEEVRASHLLIRVSPEATPTDTLAAWNKALALKERIASGEDFAAIILDSKPNDVFSVKPKTAKALIEPYIWEDADDDMAHRAIKCSIEKLYGKEDEHFRKLPYLADELEKLDYDVDL